VFTIDEGLRGLPASRAQVMAVHQSINSPHVVIPGKRAGPAQAFILALRASGGAGVFICLYLTETRECAVYVSERQSPEEDFSAQESEAVAFVESMGFIMDNLNFRALAHEEQERILRTFPVFLGGPRGAPPIRQMKASEPKTPQEKLGRLFALF
jgi:hypothetical protein